MTDRRNLILVSLLLCLVIIISCGRKGDLIPPEDGKKKEGKGFYKADPVGGLIILLILGVLL